MIQAFLKEYGRTSSELVFAHLTWICISEGKSESVLRELFAKCLSLPFEEIRKETVLGTRREIIKRFEELVDLGVQYVIAWPTGEDYELLQFLSKEVMPSFAYGH